MDTSIVLVAQATTFAQELASVLRLSFHCPVQLASDLPRLDPKDPGGASNNRLLLVSYALVDEPALARHLERPASKVAVFDSADSDHFAFSAIKRGIHGVFEIDTPIEVLLRGIRAIQAGELWFKRAILSAYAQGLQGQANPFEPDEALVHRLGLSKREMDVLLMMKDGSSNQSIAEALFISEHTVKSHISRILRKSNTHNRSEAVHWLQQQL